MSIDIYLRDVYDHTIQVILALETFRDMLSGMLDIYLSSVSNRMNEVMKVLTIIATIFIPLTLIAGIYGMNFKFMPELESPLGYPMVYVAMLAVIATGMCHFQRNHCRISGQIRRNPAGQYRSCFLAGQLFHLCNPCSLISPSTMNNVRSPCFATSGSWVTITIVCS